MQLAQILVYESDGKIAAGLRALSKEHGFLLREPRQQQACLSLLRRGGPGVLVLKVGRDLEREFTLLECVSGLFPDTATIVVGDSAHPALAGLAWDLGARFVLFPPCPRELLPDLVVALLPGDL